MGSDSGRTTLRNYRKPYRPLLVKLFNFFGVIPRLFGIGRKLKSGKLLNAAKRSTGLRDFGGRFDVFPLERLLASINKESKLHPFGVLVSKIRLKGVLENRLRAQYWFDSRPEILRRPLPPVFVITGLQRTGTTMLHRLMAADPDTRSLFSWEAINPAPIPGISKDADLEKRTGAAARSQKALAYIAPDFFAVHPVEAYAPEEDCLLLDASFLSTVPEATLRVPGYSRWLETQDQTPAYEYMRDLLKLLQWQRPGKRWILKTPHHMEYLDTLFEVFPGVKIIQTHRDPAVTLASFCSMISHGRGVFSNRVDPFEIGMDWGRKIKRMTARTIEFRKKIGEEHFYDVYYDNLVKNPVGEVEKIYRRFGLSWSDELAGTLKDTNKKNYQHKYGIHSYRLEDFGLTEEQVRNDFSEYYKTFFNDDSLVREMA